MELIDGLLDEGRVLYTDNWYTSLPLAYQDTHGDQRVKHFKLSIKEFNAIILKIMIWSPIEKIYSLNSAKVYYSNYLICILK